MSGLGSLLVGIGSIIGALTSAGVLLWTVVRSSRKERRDVANQAAREIAEAISDGTIDAAEARRILAAMREEDDAK